VTFTAAANSVGPAVSQRFSLIVNQATMTYPTNGQRNVDTTQPFSWSTIPEATGYQLTIGTAPGGADVFNSGPLFAPQASTNLSALPTGPVLYGTLSAPVTGGGATVQPFSFTAAPGMASFTFPLNGAAAVDSSKPFTWSAIPQAQNYILVVGTNRDQSGQLRASLAIPGVIFDTDPPHRSNVVCHPGHEGQRGLHPISSDHIYRPTRNGDLHLSDGRLHVR
jgi:hypothetical protein